MSLACPQCPPRLNPAGPAGGCVPASGSLFPTLTVALTMKGLAAKGSETTKRIPLRHGTKEPYFGVKIGDMKPIARKMKGRQELALELYATGNGTAQYLAGMVADGRKMTRGELDRWARTTSWERVSGTTVPRVAS